MEIAILFNSMAAGFRFPCHYFDNNATNFSGYDLVMMNFFEKAKID